MKKSIMAVVITAGILAGNGEAFFQNSLAENEYISASESSSVSVSEPAPVLSAKPEVSEEAIADIIYNWETDHSLEITKDYYDSIVEKYDSVFVIGEYVIFCTLQDCHVDYRTAQEGTGELQEDEYRIYTDEQKHTGGQYNVMYVYKAEKPGEVKFDILKRNWGIPDEKEGKVLYSLELKIDEDLNITNVSETDNSVSDESADKPSPVPVGKPDVSEESIIDLIKRNEKDYSTEVKKDYYYSFIEKYGAVSIHGEYIVFCGSEHCMVDFGEEQSGTAELKKYLIYTDEAKHTGGIINAMHVYKAEKSGELDFEIYQIDRTTPPVPTRSVIYSSKLKIDEDLNIKVVSETNNTASDDSADKPSPVPTGKPDAAEKEDAALAPVPTAEPASDYIVGDINASGTVDISDLTELALALIGDSEFTDDQKKAADVDRNGRVDLSDLARMRQYISKVISSLA